MFDLKDKKALVTGATGGIGEAIAKALAAQGATVALSGTRVEKLKGLADEIGNGEPLGILMQLCDVSQRPRQVSLAPQSACLAHSPVGSPVPLSKHCD